MVAIKVLCFLAAVGFAAAMPPKNNDDCDKICPALWAPICATDGEELRTFSNPCTLTVFNCVKSKEFQLLRSGPCETAVQEETIQEEALQEEGVQDGAVQEEEDAKLRPRRCFGCPRLYLPVCGTDGEETRMFPNECEMRAYNCEESRNFSMVKEGDDC